MIILTLLLFISIIVIGKRMDIPDCTIKCVEALPKIDQNVESNVECFRKCVKSTEK